MSLHNNPKFQIPELIADLNTLGLTIDKPSQAADAFRLGWIAGHVRGLNHQTPPPAVLPVVASELPLMKQAFRTTASCGPDKLYEMRFAFRSLEALHAADDEWTAWRGAA